MAGAIWAAALQGTAHAQSIDDLQHMSLGDLANIDVTSATKTPQSLADAATSIYVITHDDIARSGAISLPEMLRLAPNLEVEQTSASQYVIAARGLNGNNGDQNFPNKLLVLVDGRTVWSPLFSGVYWDMQQVQPEDIDRIEVISGPGAALWGANAVDGVINIITRPSQDTQGGLAQVDGGSVEQRVSLRYGGKISDTLTWRAYVSEFYDLGLQTPAGQKTHDAWSDPQGGFRLDWRPSAADTVTVQGDAMQGWEQQEGGPDTDITGRNLMGRWDHNWSNGAALQVQAYYDHEGRAATASSGAFEIDTLDLDVTQSFSLGARNHLTVGGGARTSRYDIDNTATLLFEPSRGRLNLGNLFAQDSISLTDQLTLILGVKLEDDPFSHLSTLPSVRVSWRASPSLFLWAAASKAIRAPTPFEDDVIEKSGGANFLIGDPAFQTEKLTAYEAGARMLLGSRLSASVSGFYNVYDDLRSIEFTPVAFLPLRWGNGLAGYTYGFEAWGDFQATPWWRLSASVSALTERFHFKPDSNGGLLLPVSQLGDDPPHQASLKSSMNLGSNVTLDADLRYVDALPQPFVPSYVELNARLGWNVTRHVRLSISGFNLIHDRHIEAPGAEAIPRSVVAGAQWRF